MANNILIVSHTFPPAPGIGGRRWAKFAKYFVKRGHTVYTLASENIHSGQSPWINDVEGLKVEYLPYNYPKILTLPVKTAADKIKYRLALLKVRLADKGNYYDKSIFWKEQITERVKHYIETKNIDTVIVTGAPFRLVYFVTGLKQVFKNVQFIADFRDLWTTDIEVSAFSALSKSRRKVEQEYEKSAICNSDYVFTVAEKMRGYFAQLSNKNNVVLIPNGYDPDDLPPVKTITPVLINKVKLIFAGTVYNNLEYILLPFFEGLVQLRSSHPALYSLIDLKFYGKFPDNYKTHISERKLEDVVHILGEAPYETVAGELQQAHYGVLFLNDLYNYSFSTKFCEYVGQKKKIMVVSNQGSTADFVSENNLGVHIHPDNVLSPLLQVINTVKENGFAIAQNDHFDGSDFSIPGIITTIETYLNKTNK